MDRILFPTDFSPASENAFSFALKLAEVLSSQLDIIHVYRLPVVDATNVPPDYLGQLFDEKRTHIGEQLRTFTESAPENLINSLEPVHGVFVPEEIAAFAEKQNSRLIVMGTRGEHLSRFEKFMGSITSNTLEIAKCPVIAVPFECKWGGIKKIAYATNLLIEEKSALEKVRSLSADLKATLEFVHIETDPNIGQMKDKLTLQHYPFPGIDLKVVNSPSVLEGLNTYIEDKSIDLLAMFVPKRTFLDRLFHRSLTKKMAFQSKTPLLVFRQHLSDQEE